MTSIIGRLPVLWQTGNSTSVNLALVIEFRYGTIRIHGDSPNQPERDHREQFGGWVRQPFIWT